MGAMTFSSSFLTLTLLLTISACEPSSDSPADAGADAEDDYLDTRSGFHNVTMSWSLKNIDGSLLSACPAGYSMIYANFYRAHDSIASPSDAEVKLPCSVQGTVTRPVATAGHYYDPAYEENANFFRYEPQKDFLIRVYEETMTRWAATTPYYYVDELTTDLTLTFDLYPAGGVGVLAWNFESTLTGAPLASCASAGVDQVEAAIRPLATTGAFTVVGTWACDARDPYQYYEPNGNGFPVLDEQYELGQGTTRALAPGDYEVELRAKRANAVVGTTAANLTIEDKNDPNPIFPSKIIITDR